VPGIHTSSSLRRLSGLFWTGVRGEVGRHRGKLHRAYFNDLARLAIDIGYFELADDYDCLATDLSTVYTVVVEGNRRKSVIDYGWGAPPRLNAFERTIMDYGQFIEWID